MRLNDFLQIVRFHELMCSAEYIKTSEVLSKYDCMYAGREWSPSVFLAMSSKMMYLLRIEVFEGRFKRQGKKEEKKQLREVPVKAAIDDLRATIHLPKLRALCELW